MTITWLHGLFGHRGDFDAVQRRLTSPGRSIHLALPGHDGAAALAPGDGPGFDEAVASLWSALDAQGVEETALVGYSMGARLAMHMALAAPRRVSRLVCVGGHPGLEDAAARAERLEVDRARADRLRTLGLSDFLAAWYAQPLFQDFRASAGFPEHLARRSQGDAAAIATSLERLSTGHQSPLGEAMVRCPVPTLWVAGARDLRYRELLAPLGATQTSGRYAEVEGAGHAAHLEAPEALAEAIDLLLNGSSAQGSAR